MQIFYIGDSLREMSNSRFWAKKKKKKKKKNKKYLKMSSAENFTHSVKCLSLMSTIRRPSLIHHELTVHIRIIVIGIV